MSALYSQMYSQRDARWSNLLLGYNTVAPFTIGNYGCLVTAYGNMLWWISGNPGYTPRMVNDWMIAHHGFQPGGGLFVWSAALGLGGVEAVKTVYSVAETNAWLQEEPNYAIIECTKTGFPQHFVLAPLINQIVDSWDGKRKPMSSYTFKSAHLFRVVGKGSGSSNPEDIPMTDQQEQQAYQIVLNRPREGAATGRTALQFILDAQSELAQQRAGQAQQIAAMAAQEDELRKKVEQLTANHDAWQSTYHEDPRIRVAARAGVAKDWSGKKPDQDVAAGLVIHQAGTFTAPDGTAQSRTELSAANSDWYGVPEDLFDDTIELRVDDGGVTSPGDKIHVGLSMTMGLAKRVNVKALSQLFNK